MEIRLSISDFGIGLAKTEFGVNAVSGHYVEFVKIEALQPEYMVFQSIYLSGQIQVLY